MNKGFTLVELIGTIIILSLVVLIAVPAISRSLNKGVSDADEQFKRSVELAAESWASDNKENLPKTQGDIFQIYTEDLKYYGYLDGKLIRPSDKKSLENSCVIITKKSADDADKVLYEYKFQENC